MMIEFDIPNGEVQLWWASLDLSELETERLRQVLSPKEKRRAERFRVTAATRRFVAARAALRLVLAEAIGVEPVELEFRLGQHGKPRLADGGPYFNASDSGDYVVVALTTAEVGVDIELARAMAGRERLARRVCTDGELAMLERVPDEERGALLLRLWTCKEAALKAIGTGLPGGMRNVEVEIPTHGSPRLVQLSGESDGWTLLFPDLHPTLLCSVVVRGSNWRAVSRQYSLHSV